MPCIGKIPHNLYLSEKLKQTLGRSMSLEMEVLSTNTMGELDILGHYCNVLCVHLAKVGFLQEGSQIVHYRFLQSQDCVHLEVQVIFTNLLVISWTRHEKGCLHMRSPVLFCNWQTLWRATIPSQYFQGLFDMPAFRNPFLGALLPTVGQSFFLAGSSPADIDGPTSVAICSSCLVGDNSGDFTPSPTSLPPPSISPSHMGKGAPSDIWPSVQV